MSNRGPLFLLSGLLLAPATALAQRPSVSLAWRALPGCPTGDEVVARVAQLHPAVDAHLEATATVSRRPDGRWRVRIETPTGARALQSRGCAQLAEATAVVLALALDELSPPTPTPRVRPTLPETVEQVADEERPPVLRARPSPLPTPSAPRVASLGVRAGIDPRALPSLAASGGLSWALSWRALRAELAPSVAWASGEGFDALRVELSARACVMSEGRSRLGLCATVSAGWLRVRAREVDLPRDGDAPWIAAGVTLLARLGGPRVAGIFTLDALAPLARPRFVVEGGGAWEVPAFAVALGVGAEVTLR